MMNPFSTLHFQRCLHCLLCAICALCGIWVTPAQAVTYANTATTYAWVDATGHTKVGYNTVPYKFNAATGCGTTPPTTDDTLSDAIPIGFTFSYAGTPFTDVRIMTNGRLQFNNNVYCSFGSPVQQNPYPDANLNFTMRIYGNDLDPTNKIDLPSYNTPCTNYTVCYVSYATIGVAPNRSFVVTWNNVPEWTTGSNPQGSYNLQIILQENGEFVYQYGPYTAGPSAALGQVGWQVDSTDYDTPQVGHPAALSAIKFFIPRPVAEYRMEQPSWTAAAGQVLDTSGNGRHGTALGGIQTIAGGKVCRAGNFPSNLTTGTIAAIDSAINVPTTVGNAGTATFWYRGTTAWTGAGAKDTQLLDATVVNNQWFFLLRRSTGSLRFVIVDSGGTIRAAETGANAIPANTWKHISVSWNFNNLVAANSDHLRIYLDGVLQIESAFTTANVVSAQIGTLYIGDNRSAFIGSNGTGNSADGAIDEFRIYNYEGGSALVLRDFNQGAAGCLSHYAISHSGTGVTCQQSTVTITAHDSTHANITMPNNTTLINLTTSTGRGDWTLVSGYGTLTNGTADDGAATYLFNGEYQAVLGLNHTVAGAVNINVSDGQFVESEDPVLTISTCVLNRLNACELSAPRCVPSGASNTYARLFTKLANTVFKLDMVKLKVDGTLENTFNGTVAVDLIVNSNNGVAVGANNCPTTQTAVIPFGNIVFSSGRGPAAGLNVPANAFSAISPFYSAYRDVRVKFTCSAIQCGGTAVTACSSDNFAIRPTGLAISSNMTNAAQTGLPRLKAGSDFTLTATAVPGYNGIPLIDNTLLGQKVFTHVAVTDYSAKLNANPASSPIVLGTAAVATGVASNIAMRYQDVGNVGIKTDGVSDSLFTNTDQAGADCVLGSSSNTANASGKFGCNTSNQSNTALFGRFYPDHYGIFGVFDSVCISGLNRPIYMGQAGLGITMAAKAYSGDNSIASHYTATYGTIFTPVVIGDNSNGATVLNPLSPSLSPALPSITWTAGVAGRSYTTDGSAYASGSTVIGVTGFGSIAAGEVVKFLGDANTYSVVGGVAGSGNLTLAAPGLQLAIPGASTPSVAVIHSFTRPASQVSPYDLFTTGLTIGDSDGALITDRNGLSVTGAASVILDTSGNTNFVNLRYGRLHIANAYGSELLALPVDVLAQYWDGAKYITNSEDNCTALLRANFSLNGHSGGVVASNMTTASNIPANSGTLVSGKGIIRLAKPITPPTITGKGSFNLNSLFPYLPGLGRETLGVFKNGPVIFVREVY